MKKSTKKLFKNNSFMQRNTKLMKYLSFFLDICYNLAQKHSFCFFYMKSLVKSIQILSNVITEIFKYVIEAIEKAAISLLYLYFVYI